MIGSSVITLLTSVVPTEGIAALHLYPILDLDSVESNTTVNED
jgi:hypothetical protein